MGEVEFEARLEEKGVRMRRLREHVLTKLWPKGPAPDASKEEFMKMLGAWMTGFERFVECVRMEE